MQTIFSCMGVATKRLSQPCWFTRRQLAVIAFSSTFLLALYFMRIWRIASFKKRVPHAAGIWVEVRGDVNRPGVYHIPGQNATVRNALKEAKGVRGFPLSKTGKGLNLSGKVRNGDSVMVRTAPDRNFSIERRRMTGAKCLAIGIQMPINSANTQDLLCIPGMTLKVAQNIVNYRTKHGPFHSAHDLNKVSGVGPKSILRWEPFLRFERAPRALLHEAR